MWLFRVLQKKVINLKNLAGKDDGIYKIYHCHGLVSVDPINLNYERLMINQMVVSKTLYWEDKGMDVIWSTQEKFPEVLMGLQ